MFQMAIPWFNGELFEDVLTHAKLTHHELNAALRRAGCACSEEVHSAILENNGSISVTPRAKSDPLAASGAASTFPVSD